MNDWTKSLSETRDQIWSMLARKGPSPQTVVLATNSAKGPETRILILRKAAKEAGTVTLYTDAATPKVAELTADPRCSVHFWDKDAKIQIRLRCRASLAPGEPEIWAKMPTGAREVYGVSPTPGTPISNPDAFNRTSDASKFMKITLDVSEIDYTNLSSDPHQRAFFQRADGWHGQWLAP